MDFWVWLAIIAIAWLIEAIGSAAKKKRLPPPEVPRPRPRPAPRPQVQRPVARKVYVPEPVVERTAEVERVVFEVPVRRAPRPRDPEVAESLEGVSAEVEVAEVPAAESTTPQHVRARGKYGPAAEETVAPVAARRRFMLRPATLRDAIVWTEILGRPKGGW